ncbi:MAG TPA: NmrA family NAD(P)-binding protein [Chitinophagaceae bacterium]|jgi:uncharacterized protein YbjT (DUF2867 family)|nr:NmrA family NAD(P)-binding protein [Chitinophagaceae bacterium]
MKKVLVTGATGAQGGAVAAALQAQGFSVRGYARQTQHLPAGVEPFAGDLSDSGRLRQALEGAELLSLTLPLEFDRERLLAYARNVAEAVQGSGIRHMVYNTSSPVPDGRTGKKSFDLKQEVEALFDAAGLSYVALHPTIYLDNLSAPWSLPLIGEQGLLPYPVAAAQPVSWLSLGNLARFTVAALEQPALAGGKFAIGGPRQLTGTQIAAALGSHLGKGVQYLAVAPAAFEQQLAPQMGPDLAREIADFYRFAEEQGRWLRVPEGETASLGGVPVFLQSLGEWIASVFREVPVTEAARA